ncbi:hypothetical protein J7I83_04485 [Planococcus sp. ISL-110]|nr:hypothetical protein [Planococcus sp. ISL-110]
MMPKISHKKGSAGGFVGGFVEGERKNANVLNRSILTLDIDDSEGIEVWENVENYSNFAAFLYSTHNSTATNPRYRLIVPFSRPVSPHEYGVTSQFVADMLKIKTDNVSKTLSQIMYYPTCQNIENYEVQFRDLPFFNPDGVPEGYGKSIGEITQFTNGDFKKRDPREKQNWVGAWCSVYSITAVLEKFLPGVYEPFNGRDRYTYLGGSTKGGAVLYDENIHFHSNHGTDPISGMNVNAFDLVRVHKFGHLDSGQEEMREKPSYKAMIELCQNDEAVKAYYDENFSFELYVNGGMKEIKKGDWWKLNENGTHSLLHDRFAHYVLQENSVVRFPDRNGDLYIYSPSKGIYEIDKTCRHLRSIIRSLEVLKNNNIKEIQDYIIDMSPVEKEESAEFVAVNNGLLHLKTMEFQEFTPAVFVTKKVPTNYNPEAHDSFVESTLYKVTKGHGASITNIHEMFGAVLYPTLLVPKMFYLYGRSAHNGKSTVLYMIQKTFNSGGNISAVSPHRLAENTFAGSSIYGKLANIVDDQPDEPIKDSGSLKTIITGGYLEIEAKNKDSRTVQMNTVCITASNHYPNFKEYGSQINKRLYIIPFDHNFLSDPEALTEPESMKKLESDSAREYVLKLAVEAIKEMNNRTGTVLTYNEKVVEAAKEFSDLNDPLTDFFAEFDREYFIESPGTRTFEDYLEWCDKNNIRHTFGMKRFKEAVGAKYDLVWKDKMLKINGNWKTVKGFKER